MGKSKRGDVHGWIILDKPAGPTSTQALGRVRRILGAHRAGHGGTLDPLASGVLPLAFGEATKTIPFVLDGNKTYLFSIRWGIGTSTLDAEGEVTETSAVRPEAAAISAVLPRFRGAISQTPPAFSAIKVKGARAYDLARAGEQVELPARPVFIEALRFLEDRSTPDEGWFEARCSRGTYVRSLARDIAAALMTAGHVGALRRTAAGPFSEDHAISLEKLEALGHGAAALKAILPLATALADIPACAVTEEEAERLRMGQPVRHSGTGPHGLRRILLGGAVVALGEEDAGLIRPVRVFNP